ncbi:MAG TPA: hypothetical protein VG873_12355 [Burkholderiales bacterium]|nr:hypothetical protein [Burkholderiales bacterium]
MGQIVQLSEYRKPRPARRAGPGSSPPHYFCLRCDTDHFKLFPGGTIHCAQCGALMRNLTLSDKGSS